MQCRSCGTSFQHGVGACPACGRPAPFGDNSDFSLYESSDETIPYIPYVPPVQTSSVASSQQSESDTQTYTDPQFYVGPQSGPVSNIRPLPGAVQAPAVSQQRGEVSAPVKTLLIFLVLLIVAGGGISYYAFTIRPAQNATRATAGNQTIAITQAVTNRQNTTPITTTNPQDLYNQVTSGTPVLNDPLDSQNPNNWKAPDSMNCTFMGGALHVTSSNKDAVCVATSTSFNNFAYQAQATITQGNISGLIFRMDVLNPALYIFAIDSNGAYILETGQANSLGQGNFKLLAGASSSAVNNGLDKPNLLMVIARGSIIYLYVNKQYLTSISDNTASFGSIGVLAENSQNGPVAASFNAIQVWAL